MNKNIYNGLLLAGTALLVVGTAGTVLKRLWCN